MGSGPPPLFLTMLTLDAILIVLAAVVSRNVIHMVVAPGFLVPLASGRPFARALALVGAVLEIALAIGLFVGIRADLAAMRVLLVVDVALQCVWIYTLFRADTVRFFAQKR